jgi:hypothetical protein
VMPRRFLFEDESFDVGPVDLWLHVRSTRLGNRDGADVSSSPWRAPRLCNLMPEGSHGGFERDTAV